MPLCFCRAEIFVKVELVVALDGRESCRQLGIMRRMVNVDICSENIFEPALDHVVAVLLVTICFDNCDISLLHGHHRVFELPTAEKPPGTTCSHLSAGVVIEGASGILVFEFPDCDAHLARDLVIWRRKEYKLCVRTFVVESCQVHSRHKTLCTPLEDICSDGKDCREDGREPGEKFVEFSVISFSVVGPTFLEHLV